ncbi:MAG: CDP-diacylglycerol--serine O-phosphatidyltransferase [Candidatus Cryptobacteroides sp.]
MSLKKHIPNTVTTLNLVFGIVGVVLAFEGRPDCAFYCMLAAALADFLDGTAARLLKAYSPMGKELDSLCDVVSFGVLPSALLYNTMGIFCWTSHSWLYWLALLPVLGAALRLARFNIDPQQQDSFLGLPVPVSALICGSLCYYVWFEPNSLLGALCGFAWFIPALGALLCLLMLCRLPMISFKFHKDDPKSLGIKRLTFVILCLVVLIGVLALHTNWSLAVLLCCLLYILKNIFYSLFLL